MMKIITELVGFVVSAFISFILSKFDIPLLNSILIGVIVLFIWSAFNCYLYYKNKINDLKNQLIEQQNIIKESKLNVDKSEQSSLNKRSTSIITEFLKKATHDFYITGIINNSVINTIINNGSLIKKCRKEGVKIHILFYVSDEQDNFEWYLKMLYGDENLTEKIEIDKKQYNSYIKMMNTYNPFKTLKDNGLLEVRRLDTPATTAFVAYDIDKTKQGEMQCQFYQYHTDSPESPACRLYPSDEMFPVMKGILHEMWSSASPDIYVDYIC